jgi:hypothetical protein
MQTSVSDSITAGREGALAETNEGTKINSRICEETNGIKPGRGVTAGTTKGTQAELPDALADVTGGVFEGITLWIPGREPGGDDGEFLDEETMPVLRRGVVWVETEDAVTYGDQAYCRCVAAGAEEYGAFRSDADGSDAAAVPTSRWLSTTTAAGPAQLEINLP